MKHSFKAQLVACAVALVTTLGMGSWFSAEEEESYARYVTMVSHAYCNAPERLRAALRELIDVQAAPHKIRVECAADAL
jgi:hypothetical protein